MNKRIAKKILDAMPDGYAYADGVFYWRNTEHILSGFVFESTPSYVRVHRYLMPLFEPFTAHHLGYSDLIAEQNKRMLDSQASQVDFYLASIAESYKDAERLADLAPFAEHIKRKIEAKSRGGSIDELRLSDLRYCYACALTLLREYGAATRQLEPIAPAFAEWERQCKNDTTTITKSGPVTVTRFAINSLPPDALKFLEKVNQLRDALGQGNEQGLNLVLSYEKASHSALGLT